MILPLEITFRAIEKTEALESFIREKVDKLGQYCDHISSCRIVVENHHQYQRSGQAFRVHIDIKVPPGHEIVVSKDSGGGNIHDELHVVINDTFAAAGRQLKGLSEKQRGDKKRHPQQETGAFVSRIFPKEGYGFIRNMEGREVYFRKNSVLHDDFERMEVGTGVRYVEEPGEDDPQASTIQIVNKPGT